MGTTSIGPMAIIWAELVVAVVILINFVTKCHSDLDLQNGVTKLVTFTNEVSLGAGQDRGEHLQ